MSTTWTKSIVTVHHAQRTLRHITKCKITHSAFCGSGTASALFPLSKRVSSGRLRSRKNVLVVRADHDDEIVPILSGRLKKDFTEKEYELLRHPKLLGGKTIGDELALLREHYTAAENTAAERHAALAAGHNWDEEGNYIGSNWNTLSVLYLIFLAAPALTGLFAWLSYGRLWGITPGLY